MSKEFIVETPVRFSHCDLAGIVYFPRFFGMMAALVEDWCGTALACPYYTMHMYDGLGLPVVNTRSNFARAVRLGEELQLHLAVGEIGRSSIELLIKGSVRGEARFHARHRIAVMSLDARRAVPVPSDLRSKMQTFLAESDAGFPPRGSAGALRETPPKTAYCAERLIHFSQCDPAGIVFFPRIFDLLHEIVEDWFSEGLGCPWGEELIGSRNLRVPTLALGAEFLHAMQLGDRLRCHLWVTNLGRSSVQLALAASVHGHKCVRSDWTVCLIDHSTFRAVPIPSDLRDRMTAFT
jgi:4-hydroxybenzoyl-CoA thioesterase